MRQSAVLYVDPLDASHRPNEPAEQSFFVDVSTFSKEPLNFTLKAAKMENFQIRYFLYLLQGCYCLCYTQSTNNNQMFMLLLLL